MFFLKKGKRGLESTWEKFKGFPWPFQLFRGPFDSRVSQGLTFADYLNLKLEAKSTYVLMKSIACALSCSALWRSAKIKISAALSIDKFADKDSSHITFSLSRAYCQQKKRWKHTHGLKWNYKALLRKEACLKNSTKDFTTRSGISERLGISQFSQDLPFPERFFGLAFTLKRL